MPILKRIYGIWCFLWFTIPFIGMLPLFYIFSKNKKWHLWASLLNKIWANIFFTAGFIPYKIEYRFKPLKNQNYVYCANHTSLLDIITMGLVVRGSHTFVGKESLARIPLFGYVYAKFHITFNRASNFSAYRAMVKSLAAVDEGKSIIIFPEGGILGDNPPRLNNFKDGAFRIALEKQIPIIPVTILYNWLIFGKGKNALPQWHPSKAIVHEPILTQGMSLDDLDKLKKLTYETIDKELKKYFPQLNESKQRHFEENNAAGSPGF